MALELRTVFLEELYASYDVELHTTFLVETCVSCGEEVLVKLAVNILNVCLTNLEEKC